MLMLPTWPAGEPVDHFTSFGHWAISSTLTTNHLLAIVALSNTLMSMNSAAFTDGKIIRQYPPRFKSLYCTTSFKILLVKRTSFCVYLNRLEVF